MKEIFICHASEDKESIVYPLSQAFDENNISYWLDEAEIMWGDSLIEKVNAGLKNSNFVLVVLSMKFISKNWPQRELNAALNIEASEGKIKVLPLIAGSENERKLILAEYPILNDKLHVVWSGDAKSVIEALGKRLSTHDNVEAPEIKATQSVYIPKIRKSFTQLEKDQFLRNSFNVIRNYFGKALELLQKEYQEIETDLMDVTNFKFLCKIYVNGDINNECLIWIGNSIVGAQSILYREGKLLSFDENSVNEAVSIENDEYDLYLAFSNYYGMSQESQKLDPESAAEKVWKRFTSNL